MFIPFNLAKLPLFHFPRALSLTTFFLLYLLAFLAGSSASAEDILMGLNRKESSVAFTFSSDWFEVPGSAERYNCQTLLSSKELLLKDVECSIDLSELSFSNNTGGGIQLQLLLQNLPGRIGRIKSKNITQLDKNKPIIYAVFSRGSSEWLVKLPVQVIVLSSNKAVFDIFYNGPIPSPEALNALSVWPPNSRGKLHATLTFERPTPSNKGAFKQAQVNQQQH